MHNKSKHRLLHCLYVQYKLPRKPSVDAPGISATKLPLTVQGLLRESISIRTYRKYVASLCVCVRSQQETGRVRTPSPPASQGRRMRTKRAGLMLQASSRLSCPLIPPVGKEVNRYDERF